MVSFHFFLDMDNAPKRRPRPTDVQKDVLRASSDAVVLSMANAALPNLLGRVERSRARLRKYGTVRERHWHRLKRNHNQIVTAACLDFLGSAVASSQATAVRTEVFRQEPFDSYYCSSCAIEHELGATGCRVCGGTLWYQIGMRRWFEEWVVVSHADRTYQFAAAEVGPDILFAAAEVGPDILQGIRDVPFLPEMVVLPPPPTMLTIEAQLFSVRLGAERLAAAGSGKSDRPDSENSGRFPEGGAP